MPRYHFKWENLPPHMLEELGFSLGQPARVTPSLLRRLFGARPTTAFVRGSWPVLRDKWLEEDARARTAVVKELRSRGLGDQSRPLQTADDEKAYLRSCRNQESLRRVVLNEFLGLGEGPPDSVPTRPVEAAQQITDHPATPAPPRRRRPFPSASSLSLRDFVAQALKEGLGANNVRVEPDGAVSTRRRSAVCYLRVSETPGGPPLIEISSTLTRGVSESHELLKTLNELNLKERFPKFTYSPEREVVLEATMPALVRDAHQTVWATQSVLRSADYYDTLIGERFGGKTSFHDDEIDV